LSKAADALKTITSSLNSGTFEADPSRMAKMAQSLASLSQVCIHAHAHVYGHKNL
jgi:hypothetical protein